MATLFGPSPAEVLMARQKEQEQMDMLRQQQISQQGSQFGVFAPLYQAGLQFGDIGASAMRQGLFPQQADPALLKATAIQGVLSKYAGQDMQDSKVLRQISKDLMPIDQDAAVKALTLAKSLVPESPFAKINPKDYTPESLATFKETRDEGDLRAITDKPDKVTPLDSARETVLSLGARNPRSLSETEKNQLSAATTLLRLNAPGTTVNVGDKSTDIATGTAIGKAQAAIDNKFSAVSSLKNAKKLLQAGIYAGPYAPLEQGVAKYTGGIIGSKQKVINTERFLSEIGNTVIPRLQEFGGNDSVEELRYLRDVQGGRIDLEPETLLGIIESAETKIESSIERLRMQSDAIEKGQRLPLGPTSVEQRQTNRIKQPVKRKTKSGIEYEVIEE